MCLLDEGVTLGGSRPAAVIRSSHHPLLIRELQNTRKPPPPPQDTKIGSEIRCPGPTDRYADCDASDAEQRGRPKIPKIPQNPRPRQGLPGFPHDLPFLKPKPYAVGFFERGGG